MPHNHMHNNYPFSSNRYQYPPPMNYATQSTSQMSYPVAPSSNMILNEQSSQLLQQQQHTQASTNIDGNVNTERSQTLQCTQIIGTSSQSTKSNNAMSQVDESTARRLTSEELRQALPCLQLHHPDQAKITLLIRHVII